MTERILSQTQSVEMGILQRVQAWHFAAKCAVVKFVKPWMSNHFSADQSRVIELISGQGPDFWPCLKLVGLEKSFGRSAFLRCKTSFVEKSLLFRCFRQQFYKTFVAAYFYCSPQDHLEATLFLLLGLIWPADRVWQPWVRVIPGTKQILLATPTKKRPRRRPKARWYD